MSEYLIVKPGLDTGGATIADILTARTIREVTGWDVKILTGYISQFGRGIAERESIPVIINTSIDRENRRPIKEVARAILENVTSDTRVITSQFFAEQEIHLAGAIAEVSAEVPTAVRMYNNISSASYGAFTELAPNTIGLPIHSYMEQRMRRIAPERQTIVIPPIIDTRRLEHDPERRREIRRLVRNQHGVEDDDILLVQPTNLIPRKGPSSSLYLAAKLQAETGRDAHLLMAGTVRATEYIEEFKNLLELGIKLGVNCMVDGLNHKRQRNFARLGELLCAADIAVMPSYVDDVMLSVADAAYSRVPIYTRAYCDGEGNPVFDSVYNELDCIVQRDQNVIPGQDIVRQACEVLDGTKQIDFEANAAFVKRTLTAEGIANKVRLLHETFNRLK